MLVGARRECPLVAGVGDGESFLASAIPAFLAETRLAVAIENDEIVTIDASGVSITDADGNPIEREPEEISWDETTAEKDGYETFMLKEIHEQADAVAETIAGRLPGDEGVDLSELEIDDAFLRDLQRIVIVACGTSYHAGLVGRYAIEEWARVPVEMDIASEYRYRNPVVGEGVLVIGITQSGETADTLAAMRLARERGAKVLAITNVRGSQATRDADAVLLTRAGLEVSVAATKTFVAQAAAMYLIGLRLAELRETLPRERLAELVADLKHIPSKIEETLASCEDHVREVCEKQSDEDFFLYLGRHIGLPVCLEGALKLKEISYIPTDAYAAGEMKHGPIAMLDESTPVVCVATESPVLDKVLSNVEEVRARGASTIAIATAGRRTRRRGRRPDDRGRPHRLDPAADRRDPAAAAARLRHRLRPRPQRRPAPQPREDRHRRVIPRLAPAIAAVALLAAAGCAGGGGSGSAPPPVSVAPPGSVAFAEGTILPTGELKENTDAITERVTGSDDLGEFILSKFEESSAGESDPIDFESEVVPWLGPDAGFYAGRYDGRRFSRAGLILQSTDREAAREFIDHQAESEDHPAKDSSYRGVEFKVGEDRAFGLLGDLVVLADGPAAFRDAVDASEGDSLSGEKRYDDAIADAPDDSLGDLYVDLPAILDQSRGADRPAGPRSPRRRRGPPGCDLGREPDSPQRRRRDRCQRQFPERGGTERRCLEGARIDAGRLGRRGGHPEVRRRARDRGRRDREDRDSR